MTTTTGQSAYPTTETRSNGLAIAGMVCGIVGLFLFNIILGPLAIIFGGVGLSKARTGAAHRGMAVAGIVLGVLDLVIFGVFLAVAQHNGHHTVYFHVG
jgi:hypothetical protein